MFLFLRFFSAGFTPEPVRGYKKVHSGFDHQDIVKRRGDGEREDLPEQVEPDLGIHPEKRMAQQLGILYTRHHRCGLGYILFYCFGLGHPACLS